MTFKHQEKDTLNIFAVLAVSLSTVIAMLDSTIANVALPVIAKDFGVSESASIMIINAYQFAVVASLMPFAALGRAVGNKKDLYSRGWCCSLFSSLGCALSATLSMLTAFRVIQGFGAAAVLSVNAALIKGDIPGKAAGARPGHKRNGGVGFRRRRALHRLGDTFSNELELAVYHQCSHRLPVAVAEPDLPGPRERRSVGFDSGGALLVFVLFIAFSLSTMSMTTHHLPAAALSFAVFAGLAGLLYINQKRKANAALIPIAMLHNPTLSLSLLMSMLSYSTQLLAFVSLPFYFHNVLQRNVVDIGLLLTAWPLATMASSLISGDLAKKYDPNLVALSGLACLLAGMLLMANLPSDPSNGAIVWRVALCGIGFGLFQSPNNLLIATSVSHENSSIASGLLGSSRLIGRDRRFGVSGDFLQYAGRASDEYQFNGGGRHSRSFLWS